MAPMTNAERQKKYRERLKENPLKYEELRIKHLERVKARKRKIKDLSDQAKQEMRKKWREYSARYYKKKITDTISTTPVDASDREEETGHANQYIKRLQFKAKSMQHQLKIQKEKLEGQIKKNQGLRKQIYRLKQKVARMSEEKSNIVIKDKCEEGSIKSKKESEVLSASLQSVFQSSSRKDKQVLKKIIDNSLIRKNRMTIKMAKIIGLKNTLRTPIPVSSNKSKRKQLIQEIRDFYLRDDVSRATAGKKECKTKGKQKMQIRYLLDTIRNLYKIYKNNGGKASYTTVLRHKPFYVICPKLKDCDSRACMRHENIKHKIKKMYSIGLIKSCFLEDLLKEIACDLKSKSCMHGECPDCALKMNAIVETDVTKKVCWFEWCQKKVSYKKKNDVGVEVEAFTKKCIKDVKTDTVDVLIKKFKEEIHLFKKHHYNMNHQQQSLRDAIDNIRENEAIFIVDFSENYQCRQHVETQGTHWSGSRAQITLHTGVAYIKNRNPEPFCTISPNNEHNPFSIWAHLQPIINHFKYEYPEINTIHMFSDGPTTQYRQKINFALFARYTKYYGFNHATWSFFEASHGKNAADGVGGVIKRLLDMNVAYGSDIPDAFTAFKLLQNKTSITLYYVTDHDINTVKELNLIQNDLSPLCGTMMVHQIVTTENIDIIKYRNVSCFCGENRGDFFCFNTKEHYLIKKQITKRNSTNGLQDHLPDIQIKNTNKLDNSIKKARKETRYCVEKHIRSERNDNKITSVMENQEDHLISQAGPSRGKENRIKKSKSRNRKKKQVMEFSTSDSEMDSNLYAESDDSPWYESESEKNSSLFYSRELTPQDKNKVTLLSDVKFSAENCAYMDITRAGPLKLTKIDLNYDLNINQRDDLSSDDENIF